MRKSGIIKVIAMALAMTMLFSVTAFADSGNPHFDFEQRTINLAPGDVRLFNVHIDDLYDELGAKDAKKTYSIYCVGNTDKGTYCWSNFKTGDSVVEIHIGANETAKRVTLYFYIDGIECYDSVDVNIVAPVKPQVIKASEAKSLKDLKVPTDDEIAKMSLEDQLAWYYLVKSYQEAGK